MELIDNVNRLLGDDLKASTKPGAKERIVAACLWICACEALKAELEQIESLDFTFVPISPATESKTI